MILIKKEIKKMLYHTHVFLVVLAHVFPVRWISIVCVSLPLLFLSLIYRAHFFFLGTVKKLGTAPLYFLVFHFVFLPLRFSP